MAGKIDTTGAAYVTKYVNHYSDSSKYEHLITESGLLRKGKRIGTWTVVEQNCVTKTILHTAKKYYFFDYELYFNYTFTKSIDINVEQQTATCTFTCYPGRDSALELRIHYWYTSEGIVMGRCETLQGKEIFTYQSDYLDDAFLALFDGHFNRKIFF